MKPILYTLGCTILMSWLLIPDAGASVHRVQAEEIVVQVHDKNGNSVPGCRAGLRHVVWGDSTGWSEADKKGEMHLLFARSSSLFSLIVQNRDNSIQHQYSIPAGMLPQSPFVVCFDSTPDECLMKKPVQRKHPIATTPPMGHNIVVRVRGLDGKPFLGCIAYFYNLVSGDSGGNSGLTNADARGNIKMSFSKSGQPYLLCVKGTMKPAHPSGQVAAFYREFPVVPGTIPKSPFVVQFDPIKDAGSLPTKPNVVVRNP